MAQAMTKVMYLAAIAICAFSLQGCGDDTGGDNKAEYKAAAAGAVASEEQAADATGTKKDETASTTVEKNNGCTEFQAAIKVESAKEEMLNKIVKEIGLSAACPGDKIVDMQVWTKERLTAEGCPKAMALIVSQNVLFTVEKDPKFLAWTKDEKNKDAWDKVKAGPLNVQLEAVVTPAITVMTTKVGEVENDSFMKAQVGQVIEGSVEVFCPAYVEDVKEAVKEDKALVDATVENDKKVAEAKVAAAREEDKAESKSTLAPSVADAAAVSQPSSDAALANSATEAQAASTANGVADEVTNTNRRLAEIQI